MTEQPRNYASAVNDWLERNRKKQNGTPVRKQNKPVRKEVPLEEVQKEYKLPIEKENVSEEERIAF